MVEERTFNSAREKAFNSFYITLNQLYGKQNISEKQNYYFFERILKMNGKKI